MTDQRVLAAALLADSNASCACLPNMNLVAYSLVLYLHQCAGPCDHVHILLAGKHHWQRQTEEEAVPLVGPLPHTIPDASVCEHDGASHWSVGFISLSQIYCTARVWLHGIIACPVLAVLQQQAPQGPGNGSAKESLSDERPEEVDDTTTCSIAGVLRCKRLQVYCGI